MLKPINKPTSVMVEYKSPICPFGETINFYRDTENYYQCHCKYNGKFWYIDLPDLYISFIGLPNNCINATNVKITNGI